MVWVDIAAFWLNILNLGEFLDSWKVFLGYIWAVDLVFGGRQLCASLSKQIIMQFMERSPLNHEAFPSHSPVSVCVGAAGASHRRDPTVVSTQLFPASGQCESPCPEYVWEGSSAT